MISILKHFFIQSNMTAAEERTAYEISALTAEFPEKQI